MARLAIPLVIASLAATLNAAPPEKPTAPPYDASITSAEALDIAEATFRYQFGHNVSAQRERAPVYFLRLFDKDPPSTFLARFKDHKPPVKNDSEFAIGKGLKFSVERIKRVSQTKVEVSGGYYEGWLSASGNLYTLELKDGRWIVTGDKLLEIA